MKEITINDRGVFVQETTQLTVKGIVRKRKGIQSHILSLRRRIQDSELSIKQMEHEIVSLEQQLKTLTGPFVQAYIEKKKKEHEEIQQKAQAILKELIGDALYEELQLKKRIIFEVKNGMTYKIDSKGHLYRKDNKEWRQLCIIHPQDLPLPDFLLSLFISIRENPSSYHLRRR